MQPPRGEKTEQIIRVLNSFTGEFTLRQVEQQCPGISREMIQHVMNQNIPYLKHTGHGAGTRWQRIEVIPLNKGNNRGNNNEKHLAEQVFLRKSSK